jgi:hypothetical protein
MHQFNPRNLALFVNQQQIVLLAVLEARIKSRVTKNLVKEEIQLMLLEEI